MILYFGGRALLYLHLGDLDRRIIVTKLSTRVYRLDLMLVYTSVNNQEEEILEFLAIKERI